MRSLKTQKRMAASLLKSGSNRVIIKSDNLSDVKSAITREDVRGLIVKGVISKKKVKGISRGRARVIQSQKKKGRRKGFGSRKGAKNARTPKKQLWVKRVRAQRNLVKELKSKDLIENNVFTKSYALIKGGFFRSRSHIKVYLNDHGLIKKVKK